MTAKRTTAPAEWRLFEREVADVLELAGYEVEHDCLQAGGQTDLVARTSSSLAQVRIVVECKHKRSKRKSVSIDEVENLCARVGMLRANGIADSGLLVTNTSFSRYAKKAASKTGFVRLLTLEELRRSIFDFKPYLKALGRYPSSVGHPLIPPMSAPLGASAQRSAKRKPRPSEPDAAPRDMIQHFVEWAARDSDGRVCILGDYGAGKTTFARWLAALLAMAHLRSPRKTRIPLLLPLWRYSKALDVQALVTHHITNECGISNFRYSTFTGLLESGVFLLILDGFDEMARRVDEETRYRTVADLSKLAVGRSRLILTGRPSYFPTHEELTRVLAEGEDADAYDAARDALDELASYSLVELLPFTDSQVRSYAEQCAASPEDAEELLAVVRDTYDLAELASRPVLLDMLVKSLPLIMRQEQPTVVNAAKLYEVYTGQWIDREHRKGEFRKLISKTQKLSFMQELAYQMISEEKGELSHRELGRPIRRFFGIEEGDRLDHFSHDIRTCSFLLRRQNAYRFAHLSFQEYFGARKLVSDASAGLSDSWRTRPLPAQVIRFAGELVRDGSDAQPPDLRRWAVEEAAVLRDNAVQVLAYAGGPAVEGIGQVVGMPDDVLHSFVALLIGDERAATGFKEYLRREIEEVISDVAARTESAEAFLDASGLRHDVYLQFLGKLHREGFMEHGEVRKGIQGIIRSISRIRRRQMERRESAMDRLMRRVEVEDLENLAVVRPQQHEVLEARERLAALELAMAQLPERYQRVLDLRYVEDLSMSRIAEYLGMSLTSVYMHLQRARRALREIIESQPEEFASLLPAVRADT